MLRIILVCMAFYSLPLFANVLSAKDVTVIRTEIAKDIKANDRVGAYNKYKQLASINNADALYHLAKYSDDSTFEYYDTDAAFYYYKLATKHGEIRAYLPLIEILLDTKSTFYSVKQASIYASGYLAKNGDGAKGLLSYILYLKSPHKGKQIFSLAKEGYKERNKYSALVLGYIYKDGIGVISNLKLSIAYLKKAKTLGFDVDLVLKEVINHHRSPQLSGQYLYGIDKQLLRKMLIEEKGRLADLKSNSIDLFVFNNHPEQLISITSMFSSSNNLMAIKLVFDSKNKKFDKLSLNLSNRYQGLKKSDKKNEWLFDTAQITLSKTERCFGDCKVDKRSFVELEYIFSDLLESQISKGSTNAATFSF